MEAVRKAIQWPARYIVDNVGLDPSIVVGKLIEHKDYAYGYDAQAGEYGDLYKLGIIDPRSCALPCRTQRPSRAS